MSDWVFWALLSATFAALTAVFAKVGLDGVDEDYATLLRTVIILAMMAALVSAMGKWQSPADLSGRAVLFLVLSGLATGASWVCYFRALKLGDASRVNPVDKLSVVLTALLAMAFLGERPTMRDWGGIALVCAGVFLIAMKK